MSRQRTTGTHAESAVVRFLQSHGFPHAERRALTGAQDKGDIAGCIGICWEVKAGNAAAHASDGQVEKWLEETETERKNAKADIGILVMKRKGVSGTRAGEWWAVLDLGVLADLLYEPTDGGPLYEKTGTPVRLHLANLVEVLRDAGFGSPRD